MSEGTVAQRVIGVIAKNKKVPPESLRPETKFEELNMDSLDALNLIFSLEEEFDISIPNEQAIKMKSVGDATAGVEQLLVKE
jgi:acyl carrier protein